MTEIQQSQNSIPAAAQTQSPQERQWGDKTMSGNAELRIYSMHFMHPIPTLLFLTWMPPGLIGPNFLNSTSSCSAVMLKGRLRM